MRHTITLLARCFNAALRACTQFVMPLNGTAASRQTRHETAAAARSSWSLAPCWWPEVVVWAEALPTSAAGRTEREGLARRLESLELELSGSETDQS